MEIKLTIHPTPRPRPNYQSGVLLRTWLEPAPLFFAFINNSRASPDPEAYRTQVSFTCKPNFIGY